MIDTIKINAIMADATLKTTTETPTSAQNIKVACIQQVWQWPASLNDYRNQLTRLVQKAKGDSAHLCVFPEYGGLMLALASLEGRATRQMRNAFERSARQPQLQRWMTRRWASWQALDVRPLLAETILSSSEKLWDRYHELFSDLARKTGLTIVAPSAYLRDPKDGVIRHLAAVFDHTGQLVGTQSKVMIYAPDPLVQPGSTWRPIVTEIEDIGPVRLGILLGSDLLYPEAIDILRIQGIDILVHQAFSAKHSQTASAMPISSGSISAERLHTELLQSLLPRPNLPLSDAQANAPLYGIGSYLVGDLTLSHNLHYTLSGNSAIAGSPLDTRSPDGEETVAPVRIFATAGSPTSERVLTKDILLEKRLNTDGDVGQPAIEPATLVAQHQRLTALHVALVSLPRFTEPIPWFVDDTSSEAEDNVGTHQPDGENDMEALENVIFGHSLSGETGANSGKVYTLDELPVLQSVKAVWEK
ncbi:MAG: nitrilase-related carbon-nitrogen hydrolase [Chloroflexota bacterium]